jgi:hypothetical protein
VKKLLMLISLMFVAHSTLAANADACRQLLVSTPPNEGDVDVEAYFNDAEQAYRDCRGTNLPADVRVEALMKYAMAKRLRGYTQAAIPALREAIELLDRTRGDEAMLLEALDRLFMAETDARLQSDAVAHANRALSLRKAKFGNDSAEAVTGMVQLALVHATFGNYAPSESLLKNAVRTADKLCGPECDALVEAYSGMYAFYEAQGNTAEAKKYQQLSLDAAPPVRRRVSTGKE